jgi:hypothetical protein
LTPRWRRENHGRPHHGRTAPASFSRLRISCLQSTDMTLWPSRSLDRARMRGKRRLTRPRSSAIFSGGFQHSQP